MAKQLDIAKTGLNYNLCKKFKTFEDFKKWADPKFKGDLKKYYEASLKLSKGNFS